MKETKWLTIAAASLLCSEMGLNRTPKTIRGWARNEHVIAQKKSTSNGEMWILDKASLEIKIQTEIEYRDQMREAQVGSASSEPVQTRSNRFEPVQTSADPSEPVQTSSSGDNNAGQGTLNAKIQSLEIDKAARDHVIEVLKYQNAEIIQRAEKQHQYIGHLETIATRSGEQPNRQFYLDEAHPHPEQRDLYSG